MPQSAEIVNVLIGGVALGAIYAMMAIGFSLLWQTSRTVNFAQGHFAAIAAFAFVGAATVLELPPLVAALLSIVVSVLLLGYGVRMTVVRKLHGQGIIALVIATVALGLLIENALIVFVTPQSLPAPSLVPVDTVHLGQFRLNLPDVFNLGAAATMVVGLQLFLTRTKTGKALQAVAQNPWAARVIGIDSDRIITVAFMLNALFVAVAGILVAPIVLVRYNMGLALTLAAFYSAIIGGFNQVRGAIVGGLVVGVLQTVTAAYVSTRYRDAFVLGLLILIVLFRPRGLVGTKEVVEYR